MIDASTLPAEHQRACNLYLSLAQRMGLKLDKFSDSVGALENLS
ncbi:MAG: hypothetical protein WCT04_27450 [Planctomycetota bacterium]